jgi:hypothetical protein
MAQDLHCDLVQWAQTGYEDSDDVRKKFARLSQIAYLNSKERKRAIADFSWKYKDKFIILTNLSDRDRLVVYDEDCKKAIVAIRGTDIKNKTQNRRRDLIADTYIAFGFTQRSARYKESEQVVKTLIKKFGHNNVILTGHSLGGKLAFELSKQYKLPAIVFNQFSTPFNRSKNPHSTHFTTSDLTRLSSIDPFSISSKLFDDQKVILTDTNPHLSTHTITNFV